jgi:hypothetical protein
MPGQPFTRSRAFPIFPRRFTLENRQLPPASPHRHSASPKASHVCAEITVRHNIARRNRKLFVPCEQTVDVETLLWSPEENRREIAPRYHAVALQLLPSLNRSSLRIAVHLGNDYRAFVFSMKSA